MRLRFSATAASTLSALVVLALMPVAYPAFGADVGSAGDEVAAPSPSPSAAHTLYRVGGIGCDGHPQYEAAGTVTLSRLNGQLRVSIEVTDNLYPGQSFSVEAWEEAPGCYPDNALRVPGAGLTTDSSGAGSTSFTLPFPYGRTFPDGSTVTLGDGFGTEKLVLVLDRTNSTGAGDSYAAGPLPLPEEPPRDGDGDGVPDDLDRCADSYPGYPVDEIGCARPLEIDWSVPARFTGIPSNTPAQVQHTSYPATIIVGFPGGAPCDPGLTYRISTGGRDYSLTGGCEQAVSYDTDGSHVVQVQASAGGRQVAAGARAIRVRDLLLVVLGDSVAAGEGSPAAGNLRWQDTRCHRSAAAGALGAAAALEQADRRSSVTVVHLACTGASIDAGLLGDFGGITGVPGRPIPAQVPEAKRIIGSRQPDAVLVTVGINDTRVVEDVLMPCLLVPFYDCTRRQAVFDRNLAALPAGYDRLSTALTGTLGVGASDVYLNEYFNPLRKGPVEPCQVLNLSPDESVWADGRVLGGLNAAVGAAATRHGWQHVSGMFDEFTNHGYCAAAPSRWVRTMPESLAGQGDVLGTFHPNEAGQRSYARHLEDSLRHLVE
ncbi:GDSL-type esterase/lipase family protein [Micromonospora eburnea]|uniref:GDSL-like Lipase/Acylhydrolase family protein n=1 Tax=Micromonospora eburnea TaxID=227316 RepID=A0A1C6U9L1_9ACTN|nr:GDSL-type esterase/lipase family protein [Micromonospora eburnea]SCL50706.1 GDSL-like Lipase/Acylhydrolase family protein [Micromonospora eburnea]